VTALSRLRLGTRASPLARAQADLVTRALQARHPGLRVEVVFIRTTGDRLSQGSLAPAGGKGLFVKEIEEALAAGTVDAGVHSMKDMPARLADGLLIGAVPARADARDVLVGAGGGGIGALPAGARVGTASVRRRAQLLARRRDLDVVLLRGNVDTRLRKWREGEVEALVLAAAGLERLGIVEPAARPLPVDEFLPAVASSAARRTPRRVRCWRRSRTRRPPRRWPPSAASSTASAATATRRSPRTPPSTADSSACGRP
jgi:hydroxymethylbilane synthase